MRVELAVALVAGFFSLIPLTVQIASTRAQRRDRMTRLNHLRAELELLERLHTLQGEVGATDEDEDTTPQTNVVIRDSLSKVLDEYNKLSEIAPSTVAPSTVEGGKLPPTRQLSFLRRALLIYNPHTTLGWILHTLFYFFGLIFVASLPFLPPSPLFVELHLAGNDIFIGWANIAIPLGIVLLIIQRLARRNAAQLEGPNNA